MSAGIKRLLDDRGPMGGSIAAVVLAVAWVATWRPQVDPDAWWHIALGRLISGTGTVPRSEPFSWLTGGDRIVVHSWGWDVLISGAFEALGPTGTSLLILPVTALIVALLWLLIGTAAPRLPSIVRALLILAAVIAAVPTWAPRAQTLDVAFVLATVLVLLRYLRLGDRNGLLTLPLVGILWANLHGSAILALAVVVSLAVVALPLGVRFGDWPTRPWLPLMVGGLAGLIGASINPSGPGLFLYPFDRTVASAFIPEIVEWRPPELLSVAFLPFTLLLVVTGVLLLVRREGRPDVFTLLAALTWAVAALSSARFVTIAAGMLAVAIAPPLASVIAAVAPAERPDDIPADRPDRRAIVAMTVVAVVAVIAVGWTLIAPAAQAAAIRSRLPVAAVEELTDAGCTGRLLADYGWGGYVIETTRRAVGAYGDSPERAVRDQLAVELVTADPGAWLDRHSVDVVLVPTDGPLSEWLTDAPGWRPLYHDAQAVVHVRDGTADCDPSA
jgi:hypothetical protein